MLNGALIVPGKFVLLHLQVRKYSHKQQSKINKILEIIQPFTMAKGSSYLRAINSKGFKNWSLKKISCEGHPIQGVTQ